MGVADETPKRAERLAKLIEGLTKPSATRVERIRNVASALELERVVDVLDQTNDVMTLVRDRLERSGSHYTIAEAAERSGLSPEEFRRLNLACGFADPDPDDAVFTDEDVETM